MGLGFLIHDAYLFPLFVGFIALTLWLLYRSGRRRRDLAAFWLGLAAGVLASVALWLLVTGVYAAPWVIYAALAVVLATSVWDAFKARRAAACSPNAPYKADQARSTPDAARGQRVVRGAAISVAAAAAFYGMYKSVDALAPKAAQGEIACWGINSCKGTTACTTAFNACTGQNACRGRGYLNVSEAECEAKGGRPLAGSEADPVRG